ncbi:hypothetical protein EYF80_037800 [Liparis tanakae]|uniref:Uncharacterized protein n=1 Tax=Liparis tanakae TaxID=230148 RepID=A0A4Z2GGX5_9TELE|nr:hypothetical protein EYF80_037800 [Liparis tanakae]
MTCTRAAAERARHKQRQSGQDVNTLRFPGTSRSPRSEQSTRCSSPDTSHRQRPGQRALPAARSRSPELSAPAAAELLKPAESSANAASRAAEPGMSSGAPDTRGAARGTRFTVEAAS